MSTVAVLGQSNASHLWELGGISTFSSTLNFLTNKSVSIIQGAVGGTSLLKAASLTPGYWLDKANSTLYSILSQSFDAVWWVQGEQDAYAGIGEAQYLAALVELQAILAGSQGKTPEQLPFVVSPLGNATKVYQTGWAIRSAHIASLSYPGFIRGPEYADLAVETDNIHLTSASRETFATRAANVLAPIVGVASSATSGHAKIGTFTLDVSSGANQSVTGLGFQPKTVKFLACINGAMPLSIGLDDGVTCGNVRDIGQAVADCYGVTVGQSISLIVGASTYFQAKIASMDADGFNISKTITGSPTGTATVIYEAIG